MHALETAVRRPEITDKLLAQIFSPTPFAPPHSQSHSSESRILAVLELAYQGAVQTPIKDLASRLSFYEWMAVHVGLTMARQSDDTQHPHRIQQLQERGVCWGPGQAYPTFRGFAEKSLGDDQQLYPILHEANKVAFPYLYRNTQLTHLPPQSVQTYQRLNPFRGRNLEARLQGTSPNSLSVLLAKINAPDDDFNVYLNWLPSTRDCKPTREGHKKATLRLVNAYIQEYGKLLRTYPREYDPRLGREEIPKPRSSSRRPLESNQRALFPPTEYARR